MFLSPRAKGEVSTPVLASAGLWWYAGLGVLSGWEGDIVALSGVGRQPPS